MNLKEMREKLNALADRMSKLGQMTDRTPEQESELDQVYAEFNDFAPKVEREIAIQQAVSRGQQMTASRGSVTEIVPPGDRQGLQQGGAEPVRLDRRSIGQRFAQSEQVKEWRESGGRVGYDSRKFAAGRIPLVDAADNVLESGPSFTYDDNGPIDRLAVISGTGLPSFMPAPQVVPEIIRPRDYALTMRQVIAGGSTTTDTVYFVRELASTNAAAEVGESTAFDPSTPSATNRKPESALTFEQDSVAVKTIAHWIPITKNAIADNAQLQSYVEGRLMVGADRRLNSQIANGNGVGDNLLGILQTTGVLALDDAYFSALTPALPDAAANNAVFNRILWGATVIELASDALATFVALNPYDLARMRMFSDANRNYLGGSPFVEGGIPTLWGLPVARERAIPQGTALVGDGTAAMLFDREATNILIGWINDQFVHNQLTILAELRAALAVFRPTAFAAVDVTI